MSSMHKKKRTIYMLPDAALTRHKQNGIPVLASFSHGCHLLRLHQKSLRSFLIFFDAYATLPPFTEWEVESVLDTLNYFSARFAPRKL